MCKSCPYQSSLLKTNVEPKIIVLGKLACNENVASGKAKDLEQQVVEELSKLHIANEIKTKDEKVL